MPKRSAGLLMYRRREKGIEVLLVHPGGPFWARKDAGAWTIPKGQYLEDETPLDAAKREFREETGFVPHGEFEPLDAIKQPSGKIVSAWAFEGDWDPAKLSSELMLMEWPPRTGRQIQVPEIDRAGWFSIEQARKKLLKGQLPFLDRLIQILERVR
jgi:predicted NUDIX family NTP pyrophosphohydrolase